jgi:hypothetical protein
MLAATTEPIHLGCQNIGAWGSAPLNATLKLSDAVMQQHPADTLMTKIM